MTALDLAAALPDIATLRERCRMLALLDTIISSQSEYASYSFSDAWAPGVQVASMDNGSGDDYSIVFSAAGAFLRGFDHESAMSPYVNDYELWPGLITGLPAAFAGYLEEPAFQVDDVFSATCCLWRETGDDHWHSGGPVFPAGADPDGSGWMFALLLDPTSASYTDFATDCYEQEVDAGAVAELWATRRLDAGLLHRLNPGLTLDGLAADLAAIGRPLPG